MIYILISKLNPVALDSLASENPSGPRSYFGTEKMLRRNAGKAVKVSKISVKLEIVQIKTQRRLLYWFKQAILKRILKKQTLID